MVSKRKIQTYVKHKLETDPRWAVKALMVVYANQTPDEQDSHTTQYWNSAGFCSMDAELLTSFAEQYRKRGSLSRKQMELLHRKIPKYWKQIISASQTQGKYEELVSQVEQTTEPV